LSRTKPSASALVLDCVLLEDDVAEAVEALRRTPGGTILQAAHPGIESPTLDRGAAHLKDELMRRFAELDLQWLPFSLASKAAYPDLR
jgi:hypothetical protein